MKNFIIKTAVCFCVVFVGAAGVLWLWPVDTSGLISFMDPASDYHDSVMRISRLSVHDEHPDVADYCRSIFLSHGEKTERAVVMYHGYTNCPRQYEDLAQLFFERGYNVYVPRIPHHGLKNRVNPAVGRLTLAELLRVVDISVDAAQGLGEQVTVLGLSMGGVMTAWAAQFRNDIDTAVILVPSFGWYYLPGVIKPMLNLAYLVPDQLLWWHPRQRESRPIPYSMYHKFSSRGMGHTLMMSLAVLRASRKTAPSARKLIVITTELDRAVDELNVLHLMENWDRHGAVTEYYQFPAELGIEHDVIDPLQQYQQTDSVYQKIFEMIEHK